MWDTDAKWVSSLRDHVPFLADQRVGDDLAVGKVREDLQEDLEKWNKRKLLTYYEESARNLRNTIRVQVHIEDEELVTFINYRDGLKGGP